MAAADVNINDRVTTLNGSLNDVDTRVTELELPGILLRAYYSAHSQLFGMLLIKNYSNFKMVSGVINHASFMVENATKSH